MFIISAYDLHTGEEVAHEEKIGFQSALDCYAIVAKHFTNYFPGDCFGVMMYCGNEDAHIIFGFEEAI